MVRGETAVESGVSARRRYSEDWAAGYAMKKDALYRGFYIGPFRKKRVVDDQAEIVSHDNAGDRTDSPGDSPVSGYEINFDKWCQFLQNAVQKWGKEHGGTITLETAEHRHYDYALDVSIKKHIDNADFVIALIAAQNLNAALELGYAQGREKPGIVLIDGPVPSDLQGMITVRIKATDYDSAGLQLPNHLLRIDEEIVKRQNAERFSVECLSRRDVILIGDMIASCKQCIHILQTNLQTVTADHIHAIKQRVQEEIPLRILTMDPQSAWVNERARQLNYSAKDIGVYRDLLENSLDFAKIQLDGLQDYVRIKVYNDFPTQMTYRFDQQLLVCTVSRITLSRENASFLVDDTSRKGIQSSFIDHFSHLWHSDSTRTVFGELADDALVPRPIGAPAA